jgi:hypothetical protein
MDLQSQFKDLNLDENIDKVVPDESDKLVKDLEARLAQIKTAPVEVAESEAPVETDEEATEVVEEEYVEEDQTFYEKAKPFILPLALTLFAIIFAGMFLYFFSKSRVEQTAQAIVNQGVPEQVYYPPAPIPVIIKEEPLVCTEPLIMNETGDGCVLPEPEPEPAKVGFEDGKTVEMNVRFSYDKFSYDNSPRGIFVLKDQTFEGEYEGFKVSPNNRAYANDYFFGIDRYTVSLIGSCVFVVDNAKVEIENAELKDKYFTGKVTKVIEASKPRVDCRNAGVEYNEQDVLD